MRTLLFLIFIGPFVSGAFQFKDGPFDGQPFKPSAPIVWSFTNRLPESLMIYRLEEVKLSQSAISNALLIGRFSPLNLIKSKDPTIIEFRDKRGEYEFTRFLKLSAKRGWVKYYDKTASATPVHLLPSLEEAERLALHYFMLLGGNTNEAPSFPWPHNESTITTYEKPGGREMGKYVSSRSIRVSRQTDGIWVIGDDFTITFGNDGKPSMIDMNWPPLKPIRRCKVAMKNEILAWVKKGKAFIQVFPPPSENIAGAELYTVKNVLPLYAPSGEEAERLIKPYASLLVGAKMNGRQVEFVVNCPIVADADGNN